MDRELYLPISWTDDRDRRQAAHIPDERDFATKPDLAKTTVLRAIASPLPIAWVTADAAYGQGCGCAGAALPTHRPLLPGTHEAWEPRSCGDGAKGPGIYHWAALQITSIKDFDAEVPTHQRWVLARRSINKPESETETAGRPTNWWRLTDQRRNARSRP